MEKKTAALLATLTLEEKALLLTGRDFWSTPAMAKGNIPSAYLSDGPHGVRRQQAASDHLGLNKSLPATCFPTAAAMANSWNPALGEKMGELLGEEAACQRVNVLLGPGLNIKRNPRCGRNFEYFSEDPHLAGKMAAAYVRGIQKNGISACLKHFAANNQEKRRMDSDSIMDERTLREIYLTGFEIAVTEGHPLTVMTSYNRINGIYANENRHLLKDILRGEWGYRGMIVTDWGGGNDRTAAIAAGSDLEMPACPYGAEDILTAVKKGTLKEKDLDESLSRVLETVFYTDEHLKGHTADFDRDAHHAFAALCARECAVLLKNDENLLPLNAETSLCVIGDFAETPRFQGAGSSIVNPTKTDTVMGCIAKYPLHCLGYAKGYHRYGKPSPALIKEAVTLAQKAEVILCFIGLDERSEAEGIDRPHLKLPQNQLDLVRELNALGKKVVILLSCGAPVELDGIDASEAILYTSLGGQAGASAVLDLLTGKANPSGKLSETFPLRYEDVPSSPYFHHGERNAEYREGLFVGYRYYLTAGVPVRYPFGYGLSYTKFSYSNLKIADDGVRFTLKNAGERDGAEVAQLYIEKMNSKIFRPLRELKGFQKVYLKQGEERQVFLPFDERTFRYYDTEKEQWQVEKGLYRVAVGASSEDIRLTGTVEREGRDISLRQEEEKALSCYFSGHVKEVNDATFMKLIKRNIPHDGIRFIKRNRIVTEENTTVADLRYARRWVGRFLSFGVRFSHKFFEKIGKQELANTLMMGAYYLPVRSLAKFGKFSRRQLDAFLAMCNGHVCKGFARFVSKEKK